MSDPFWQKEPEELPLREEDEIGKFAYDVLVRYFVPNPIQPMPQWDEQSIEFRSAFVTAIITTMRKYSGMKEVQP